MPVPIDVKIKNDRLNIDGCVLDARTFAFPFYFYYFSRSGRLPHAGWEGSA
jgi:hypothetical protein